MNYGIIHRVVFEKGYGFIRPDRGGDIFFHALAVQDNQFNFIQPDQPVKYELEEVPFELRRETKPRAKIVILIERIPGGILEQDPETMRAKHHPKSNRRKATWKRKIDLAQPMAKPLPEIRPIEPLPGEDQPAESPAEENQLNENLPGEIPAERVSAAELPPDNGPSATPGNEQASETPKPLDAPAE
jgi:cold shock CspA family protein